ncbi:MAG: bifunctional diaminohydroxyphosphoribosylaminopyrimidine deaminase/5-amino-6-(5-phosphoribosylamino)uracil reductase RibD [Bernardetiaceae bacterium]|nr:bifunctional diaminohydroxyphosphoribosylaminopyrimidine deaminase/5-amino-6-(5-phosphoribosylamino)uracil reductase RibD [Bernardetiaceae bacterium]
MQRNFTSDTDFMQRALELAERGLGSVSPNPLVGAVIVKNQEIIGEGWHRQYGKAHAEVNAIEAIKDKTLIEGATVFVSLEPCSHYGKTPPCADLLIRYKPSRVVVACQDPNPKVSGSGIKKLKEAGIDVEVGVLEEEARYQNRRFFHAMQKAEPFVILKWAQTQDGFIARQDYSSKWISDKFSRRLVHRWRSEEDAVLVGTNTAYYDNPQLTVRDWYGKNPLRVCIDRNLRLQSSLAIFDGSVPTVCYTTRAAEDREKVSFVQLSSENFLPELLSDLHKKNIHSLIIEGGAKLLEEFIAANLWQEARVFIAPVLFSEGIAAPKMRVAPLYQERIMQDNLWIFENRQQQ